MMRFLSCRSAITVVVAATAIVSWATTAGPALGQQPRPTSQPDAVPRTTAAPPRPTAPPDTRRSQEKTVLQPGDWGGPKPGTTVLPEPPITILYPPDGKWLVDEEGREYYLTRIRKDAGLWVREGKMVRFQLLQGRIEKEDDVAFYIRRFRGSGEDEEIAAEAPGLTPLGEKPAADPPKAERVAPPKSSRLLAERFDEGLPKSGQWRNGFELADMNGDGKLDLVHGAARKGDGKPAIFLGDGRGTWQRWPGATFPPIRYDYGDVAVADFNRDGFLDLGLAVHLKGLLVLVGDGKGKVTEWRDGLLYQAQGPIGSEIFSSRAITAADWNGDRRPDLIALGDGPRFSATGLAEAARTGAPAGGPLVGGAAPGAPTLPVNKEGGAIPAQGSMGPGIFLNQGTGAWLRQATSGDGRGQPFGDDVVAADLDGDRRLDFVTATSLAGFREILYYGVKGGGWERRELKPMLESATVFSVRAADLDGDRATDLVVSSVGLTAEKNVAAVVDLYRGRPGRTWARSNLYLDPESRGIKALALGDFEGDGVLDIAAGTSSGGVLLFLRGRDGSVSMEELPDVTSGCNVYHLEAADLDGDRRAELVAAFAGEPSAMAGPTVCPTQGGLVAWRFKPAPATSPQARATP